MTDDDLPPLFHAADVRSNHLQARHFALQRVELGAIVLGAILVEISWSTDDYNLSGLVGAALLASALIVRIIGRIKGYESRWHLSRSLAERIKSLAWQYAAAGGRYPPISALDTAEQDLAADLAGLAKAGSFARSTFDEHITSGMRTLRESPAAKRGQDYIIGRIEDQRSWYSTRAENNRRVGRTWSTLVAMLEALAVLAALASGLKWFDFGWTGVFGAAAAAGLAWHQARRHSFLASSYGAADQAVAAFVTRLEGKPLTDDELSRVIGDAEETFAREHGLWLDSHIWS